MVLFFYPFEKMGNRISSVPVYCNKRYMSLETAIKMIRIKAYNRHCLEPVDYHLSHISEIIEDSYLPSELQQEMIALPRMKTETMSKKESFSPAARPVLK